MERFGGGAGGCEYGYEVAAAEQLSRQQERHYRLLSELQALVKALPRKQAGPSGVPALSGVVALLYDSASGGGGIWGCACCSLLSLGPVSASGSSCSSVSVKDLETRTRQEEVRYFTFFPVDCYLFQAVEQRIREEQRMMDEKIVLELDQKVIDQQSTLEKAGVSGFYITTNPQELTLQMNLLELIRKLQQKESEYENAFS
ncbi:DGCR6 protein, partial [Caloenas nicobarica]|nr:DGCR6 protein [Caloenas nicobarica]